MKRFLFLVALLPSLLLAQYTIKGTFSPAEDYNAALLYKVTPTLSEYVANSKVEPDGGFEFQLDSMATKGMYRVVYAVPQEDYNFDVIYNKKEDIELTFNAETGVKFLSSSENKLIASYTNSMSMVTQSIGNYFRQQSEDTLALKAIFKTQKETQLNFENAAKDMVALHFIKANQPYIPQNFEDVKTYVNNLKTHYFDHVDFNNKTLQSSSFLEERMLNYVFGMSDEALEDKSNYKNNIDNFSKEIKDVSNEVKRILLVDLWEQMKDLGFESVANYISETYLLDIAVALNDQELINDLMLLINTAIGEVAPDFVYDIEKDKKLSELNSAENYILVFWSSSCSHCLDEIPQLQTFIKSKKEDVLQVVAIGLEDEPLNWKNLTKQYQEFIHVYGEGKWDNEIGNTYGVTATPTYFVLNKDKKIISKPEDFDELKAYFNTEEN